MDKLICLLLIEMLIFIIVVYTQPHEEETTEDVPERRKREIPRGYPSKNKGKDLGSLGVQPNVLPYYNNIPQIIYLAPPPMPPPQVPPVIMEKKGPVVQPIPPPQPPVIVFQPPVFQPQPPSAKKPPTTTTECPVTAPLPDNPPVKLVCPAGDKLCSVNTGSDAVQYAIIKRHNNIRKLIKATNMLKMHWDPAVASAAQAHADQCSLSKQANPSISGFACSQNIFSFKTIYTWDSLIAKWNRQRKQFKYGTNNSGTLEYAHMIAASSQTVGCAFKDCGPKGYFYVCNYCPTGPKNSEANPYIPGTQCADCKCHCNNDLCLRIG